jgi:hypothetical protein
MIRSKKTIVSGIVVAAIIAGLFYLFLQRENEDIQKTTSPTNQPIASWQKITITEEMNNSVININLPKIIIYGHYDLASKVNEAITQHIEYSKDWFISGVTTAAEKDREASTLDINTEILLMTPRLISLAFTSTEHLAGIQDSDPEQMFLVFDLVNGGFLKEGNELFRDDIAWSRAVKAMKKSLLADYQGDPNCDLFFAPKHSGFAASCIGVDWSRGHEHLSLTGDIPISVVQEFLAPSVLSDITKL